MMLDHLGHSKASAGILAAVDAVLERGVADVLTPDVGGNGTTESLTQAILDAID
jgi:tartrate dehydrogenase/decarboxylase/D-malate dehydrogenase